MVKRGRSPEECSLFPAARGMGKCIWQESCGRECQFNRKVVVQVSMAGFKVPPRAWKRRGNGKVSVREELRLKRELRGRRRKRR